MGFNFVNFKKTFWLFAPHLFRHPSMRKRCFFALGLILIDIIASSLVPYFSKCLVEGLSLNLEGSFTFILLFLGFFWTTEKIASHVQEIIFFPVINGSIRGITFDVVQHIHQMPLTLYQRLSMPEILSCIKRISVSARAFYKIFFLMIIPTFIKLIVATIIALKVGLLGYMLLPTFILCFITLYKGTQWYVKGREQSWQATDTVTMRINDSIINSKIARPFQHFEMEAIGTLLTREANLWYKANTRLHFIHILIGSILGAAITFILWGALFAIQNQTLSVGDFVMIKGYLIAAFLPLKSLSVEFRQLAESTIDIRKIIEIIDLPVEQPAKPNPHINLQRFNLVLNRVGFEYEAHQPILSDLSLHIPEGEKLAIVGESGSGKSTLVSLMSALLAPSTGSLLLNGLKIQDYPKDILSKTLHYIPQDLRLFNLSLIENLTYGLDHISASAVEEVIERIDLVPLFNQLKEGLNTRVGEMGIRLSGGEKQRVALARALLLKPKILILDETLHSLNVESETKILKYLFEQIPTVILVSHHSTTLPLMDRILKIQNGSLVEVDCKGNLCHSTVNEDFVLEDIR